VIFGLANKNAFRKKPLAFPVFFTCVIFAICMALTLSSCEQKTEAPETESNRPVITIGSADYAPFMNLDNNGDPTGIDVEIITEAFNRVGYDVEFVTIHWEDKEKLLESGEVDCVSGGFTIEGREDSYLWTKPYMHSNQVVVVNSSSSIQTLSDLDGKIIAVQSSSSAENALLNHTNPHISTNIQVFSFENNSLPFAALGCNYVDALIADEPAVIQYMKNYSTTFTILDEPAIEATVGTAFAKNGDAELCQKVNDALDEMYKDGTLAQIIDKYLDNADSYLEGLSFE
jgi:polar amino acid transport system substrate-binding protein